MASELSKSSIEVLKVSDFLYKAAPIVGHCAPWPVKIPSNLGGKFFVTLTEVVHHFELVSAFSETERRKSSLEVSSFDVAAETLALKGNTLRRVWSVNAKLERFILLSPVLFRLSTSAAIDERKAGLEFAEIVKGPQANVSAEILHCFGSHLSMMA